MAGGLQQLEGAYDVGLDEGAGVVDRAVDVALGGEVDHRRGTMLGEDAPHLPAVRDVAVEEREARIVQHAGEVLEAAGIGELVEHEDAGRRLGEDEPHEVAADETGAAGDEDGFHEVSASLLSRGSIAVYGRG